MDFYRPTYAEYIGLRESFLTLVDDYLLVYKLRGVTRLSDLYVMEHNPSYLGEIREGAIRMTDSLLALVTHVDELAEQGAQALGQEWPDLLAQLESHAGVREDCKRLGRVVRDLDTWGEPTVPGEALVEAAVLAVVEEKLEEVRQGKVGRPELYDLEEFINLFKQVLTTLKRIHPRVTQRMVAEKLFPNNFPSRYYYRDMLRGYLHRLAKAGCPVSDFRSLVDYIDNPPSLYPLIPTNDAGQ